MKDHYEFVKSILEKFPDTRDDDMKLYAYACWKLYVPSDIGFYNAVYHHKENKLPNYESLTRARRKVQQNEEHLRGSRYKNRQNEERKYRDRYSPW